VIDDLLRAGGVLRIGVLAVEDLPGLGPRLPKVPLVEELPGLRGPPALEVGIAPDLSELVLDQLPAQGAG
jgi:hypothetical protein